MANDKPSGRFCWYDLMTTDPKAAIDFYPAVTGWGTEAWEGGDMPYTMWANGGKPMGGAMQLPAEAQEAGVPSHWLGYISTPDVDASLKQATALGGQALMEPMDLDTVGRFCTLADPFGAIFSLFTAAGDTPGHDAVPAIGEISWHELMTVDFEKAFEFYGQLFDWQVMERMDMGPMGIYQIYGREGVQLGGMMNKPEEMPVSAWLYYSRVADLDSALQQVTAQGGQILNGPMEVPDGDRVAQCMDSRGAAFALHQTKA